MGIKNLLVERCPDCHEALVKSHDRLRSVKSCPNKHYTEETYAHLGVRIVYHK